MNERSSKVSESIEQAVHSLFLTLSTSYGPKGMDKMLIKGKDTVVTNDGATIMSFYKSHPIHKILSNVSATQDANCGDGTTSVILLIGCLVEQIKKMKDAKIHPSKIVDALEIVKKRAIKYIDECKVKIEQKEFLNVVLTTLNSKIASKSLKMAQIAIESLEISKKEDIRIIKKVGGNIDDIKLMNGLIINNDANIKSGMAKMLIIQFCISSPKTNLDSKIIINDYSLMEKFVKEEREYVINIIKRIRNTGANLLVIQKSIVRESCSELAMHFLNKIGIAVINNVDRKDIEVLAKSFDISPVSDVDLLGAPVDVEVERVQGMICFKNIGCSIIVSGCDNLVLDEAERSLNDALCVVKCLKNEPYIVAGGGSIEMGIYNNLDSYVGPHSLLIKEISTGFLGMPHLLAQNAGLYPVEIISNLKKNIGINKHFGVSLRTGFVADMINDDSVVQPAAVSKSTVVLAIETVQMLARIDDILPAAH
jgi:T-complex protein 1 subunit delta